MPSHRPRRAGECRRRIRDPFLRSHPSVPLALAALGVVPVGAVLPSTSFAHVLGFQPLPSGCFVALAGLALAYLLHIELGKRALLGSGGHVAGIVSPPGPKAWHLLGKDTPASAADWHAEAKRQSGSWWEDWETWSAEHSGPMGNPPPMGSKRHPVMAQGPGEYIRT